jgi:hypothetical protein
MERTYRRQCDRNDSESKLVAMRRNIQVLREQLSGIVIEIKSINTQLDGRFEEYAMIGIQN